MGPACTGLSVFTFFRNLSIPMGVKGTPKSGQLVKCSWDTSRGALQPSGSCCRDTGGVSGGRPAPPRRLPGQPGARVRGGARQQRRDALHDRGQCLLPARDTHRAAWGPGQVGSGHTPRCVETG